MEQPVTISIYNMNIKKQKNKPKEWYAQRVNNVAQLAARKDNDRSKTANIFGISEAYYKVEGGWTKHHKRGKIPCINLGDVYTHECLIHHWLNSLNSRFNIPQDFTGEQYGDVALVASGNIFDTNNINFIKRKIGSGGGRSIQYKIIGAKIPIKRTNYVLPFYSVHLPTKSAENKHKKCCKDIVKITRSNWNAGDLPPVIVGDFNFNKQDTDQWSIMSEYYDEVGDMNGNYKHIELIWIGKRSKFSGASRFLLPKPGSFDLNTDFAQYPFGRHGKWPIMEFFQTGGRTYRIRMKENGYSKKRDSNNVRFNLSIYAMKDDGTLDKSNRVNTRRWSEGWTHAKPYWVGNRLYIFVTNCEKNKGVGIREIRTDGTIGDRALNLTDHKCPYVELTLVT